VEHPPGVLDAAAVRRVWDEILNMVRRKKPRIAALMREATVREVKGNTLVLLFKHNVHADMLSKSPEILTEAITEVFGGTWQVRCEVGGAPGGVPRSAGTARSEPGPAKPPSQVSAAVPGQANGAARSPRPASGPGAGGSADEGDDGWPTPARPGGATASAAVAAVASSATADDWPTPARPGGQAPADGLASVPDGAPGPEAAPAVAASVRPRGAAPAASGRSAAVAAARAAASGLSGRQAVAGRPTNSAPVVAAPGGRPSPGARPAADVDGWRDASAVDEPPYDPDYDPPVHDPQFPGFDPGDEPTDEVIDERVVRESSEEQALRLLAEALGAEKIDDGRR
jgi:DNA polymerase-3 subunit gamma/tau